ncbi:MAG: hypothetical protein OHK0013_37170 [Sandaracinaceae bacterium]
MAVGVSFVLSFVMMLASVVLAIVAQRAWKTPWLLFGVGALAFVASKIVQIPLMVGLQAAWLGDAGLPTAVSLAIAFCFAPLCEESARWIALRAVHARLTEGDRGHRDALFFGLGHGGAELSILAGLTVLNLGVAAAGLLPPEFARTVRQNIDDAPWWLFLAGPLERAVALCAHLGMSWLVWRAVREGRARWLLASMAVHYVLNAAIVGPATLVGDWAGMVGTLLVAPGPILLLLWARAHDPAKPRPTRGEPDRQAAISCRGLGKTFAGNVAVEDLDLDVKKGELFALLGPNGAGKTTLVRMLAGLIPPSTGRACVAGHELGEDDDAIRSVIGVLTETPGLYETLSAEVNLRFFGRLSGLDDAKLDARIEHLLRRFQLWERRGDAVGSFSKGMRQKVSIARVLLHDPAILFLDEPTSGLDPSAAEEVHALISELKRDGRTIVLTTHRLAEAEELADRVGILQGRMLEVDSVSGLRRRLFGRRVRVRLADFAAETVARARELLGAIDGVVRVEDEPRAVGQRPAELLVAVEDPDVQVPRIARALVGAGLDLRTIADVEESLEDVYLDVIARAKR